MVKRCGPFVRATLAVSVLTMHFAGTASVAALPAAPEDAVPRSLLLEYLADETAFTLIDARSPAEFAESRIAGAINIPHDSSADILSLLPRDLDAPIVVYCRTGRRAGLLKAMLTERGYTDVRVLLPEQIVWFEGNAVFNCGTPAAAQRGRTIESFITEGKREEEQ